MRMMLFDVEVTNDVKNVLNLYGMTNANDFDANLMESLE